MTVELAIQGAVQALIIVIGAVVAVWLDRKSRYRRDVEQAVLELSNRLSFTMSGLVTSDLDRGLGSTWHDNFNRTWELIAEIRMKARGFYGKKRRNISEESRRLLAAVAAANTKVSTGERLSPAAALVITGKSLQAAVFGEQDPLYAEFKEWSKTLDRMPMPGEAWPDDLEEL